MPIDWASRRAGSMVSTTTLRPRSAARSASAADVVVLPTPPDPQHTMMSVAGSSSRASTSRTGEPSVPATRGPTRVVGLTPSPVCRARLGQLVEPAEVDAVRQPWQLVGRYVEGADPLALCVFDLAALGVLTGLVEETVDQRLCGLHSTTFQVGPERVAVQLPGHRPVALLVVELRAAGEVDDHPADGEPLAAQVVDAVGGLLHRHLLEHGDQVHRRAL